MKRLFVETSIFCIKVGARGGDAILKQIQELIMGNPEVGATIAGTGGIRKMRLQDKQRRKGKRGGLRILYLDLPDQAKTFLITLYDKGEKDDISSDEKISFVNWWDN